jgi:hypothetical protein
MTNLNDAIELLQAKRLALLTQLTAVDQALAALASAVVLTTAPAQTPHDQLTQRNNLAQPATPTPTAVVPAKIKSPRMLSDEHKHALNEGRRRARHLADVKAGRARERADVSTTGSQSRATSRPPRLVKQTER